MSNSSAETKARLYYKSCMDEDKIIEKLGDKPLQDLLRKVGGWNISTRYEHRDIAEESSHVYPRRIHKIKTEC